ncbi:Phosphatidylinositol transfer protein/retinal degeneration b protein, partial [Operophtera brumata]
GKYSSGQYTYKIYHLASKVPAFIRLLAPKGALEVHEEAWNAYPYCRTVLTNPGYMKDNFVICIETLHVPDGGDQYNNREVVHIDIANDPLSAADYKEETDPTLFKSKKTGRGPLTGPNWKADIKPSKVETVIQKSERRLFTIFHRQVFCSIDDWYGMTMADIRAMEDRTKTELERLRREGEVRGMRADN